MRSARPAVAAHLAVAAVLAIVAFAWLPVPSAAAEITVRGTITDAGGSVLEGARVELSRLDPSFDAGRRLLAGELTAPVVMAAHSDRFGRYQLRIPEAGVWSVAVRASGYVPVVREPLVAVSDLELATVALPIDASAYIEARTPAGKPFAHAWIFGAADTHRGSLGGGWRLAFRKGRTDLAGRVRLPRAPDEELTVTLLTAGGMTASQIGIGTEPARLAAPAGVHQLLEVRRPDDVPAAEVLVRAGELAWPIGLTDALGRLSLPLSASAPVSLWLAAADGSNTRHEIRSARPDLRQVLVLPTPGFIDGGVTDAVDGVPVAGAVVWADADPGAFTRSDDQGRFRLARPSAGRFRIQAEAAGYRARAVSIAPRGDTARGIPILALPRAVELAGRVRDPRGSAVPGAALTAIPRRVTDSAIRLEAADGRAASARDGRFSLGGLAADTDYRLRVERAGFTTRTIALETSRSGATPAIDVVLERIRPLHGLVVDHRDKPVADAEVVLRRGAVSGSMRPASAASRRQDPYRAVTGPDGRFTLPRVRGSEIDIQVVHEEFAPLIVRRAALHTAGDQPLDLGTLVLTPGAAVAGTVIDNDGKPVAGATVYTLRARRPPSGESEQRLRESEPEALTDDDGLFEVTGLVAGEPLSLAIFADGYAAGFLPAVSPPAELPLVILGRGLSVAGQVVDGDEQPIADAEIALTWRAVLAGSSQNLRVGSAQRRLAVSDAQGGFEIAGLEPGAVNLDVFAPGFAPGQPRDLVLHADTEAAGIRFVLSRGAVVEGQVTTTEGEPVAGAQISAGQPSARTNSQGRYRLEGIPTGMSTLIAAHRHYPQQRAELEIGPDGLRHDWTFEAGTTVSGQVIDTEGAPVALAKVQLHLEARGESLGYDAQSAADGSFLLRPVAAGIYRLQAASSGFASRLVAEPVTVTREPIEGLQIVLQSGASVFGEVSGLDFDQLARVRVEMTGDAGDSRSTHVDYSGQYEIRDLTSGDWSLRAELDGGKRLTSAHLTLRPGRQRQDLVFSDLLRFSGTVLYQARPLTGASVSLVGHQHAVRRTLATDYRGDFSFEDLAAGSYRLEITSARELLVHNETIEVAGDRHLVVELESTRIAGRVVAADTSAGLSEALVTLRHGVAAPGDEDFLIGNGSGEDGWYELPRVPPGHYRMVVRKDGYAPHERALEVRSGADTDGVDIALDPTPGLALSVRLASGQAPPHVDVAVLGPTDQILIQESRQLDGEGRTQLATVPPGDWRLLVGAPGGVLTTASARVPGEAIDVVLPASGRLRLEVRDLVRSDRAAEAQLFAIGQSALRTIGSGGVIRDRWPLAAGSAIIDGVAPGTWVVQVSASDGRRWSGSVVVTSGVENVFALDN